MHRKVKTFDGLQWNLCGELLPLERHQFTPFDGNCVQACEFHPSGTCVGVATTGNTVEIYDIRASKLQQLYSAHENSVNSIRYNMQTMNNIN